jgi:hypothetical protein
MRNETVVAILWTLVAVSLVCFFAALVSVHENDMLWSHPIAPPHKAYTFGGRR